MQALINAVRILIAVLPAIVQLIQAIEKAVPLRGVGPDKLQLLKDVVTDIYDSLEAGTKQGVSLEGILSAAVSIANRFVALFNRIGWPAL
jgi:hypothetical protein